jgi:phosphonate metabolism protein PhnN/1,5-bisphosphokinase (PRPP-forming)
VAASPTGTLVLVVGPSGVGKDSIIAGAASRLRADPSFVFARRSITRPLAARGEAHVALSSAAFAAARARGAFLLHWQAHGLDYGIPAALAAERSAGRIVVANVSRTVIDAARAFLPPVRIVQILAPREVLATRLASRGRESAADIGRRLERAAAELEPAADVTTLVNDGALEHAVAQFVAILRGIASQPAASPAVPARR